MITKPTVFILGAGASKPFGYPTGNELKDLIVKHFDPGSTGHKNLTSLGIKISSIEDFKSALFKGSQFIPGVTCSLWKN